MNITQDFLEPATEFIKEIGEEEEVLIIHHWDMDGTSSSVIVSKLLKELRGKPADNAIIPRNRGYHLEEKDTQMAKDADKLIVLDFNLQAEELENLDKHTDVLVVDHHNFDRKPDVNFVNPREVEEDVYIPCSRLALEIAEVFDMENELRWVAGLGVIQDFGVDSSPELFKKLKNNYEPYLPEDLNQETLAKQCEYGRYSSVLNIKPYRDSKKYAKLAYQALMKSDDLKELEAQEEYRKVYEVFLEMQDEFKKALENYEEEREIDREKMVIFFEIDSEFRITSSIATNKSANTPEWIHLVIQKKDGEANISARCQSGRVDLGEKMKESLPDEAREEGAEAGGHQKAAGASFPEEYLDEFKSNLLENLE